MHTEASPIAEKAHAIKQNLSELGSLAVDAAKVKASDMKDGMVDLYDQGCDQVKKAQQQTEQYVKREPMKALLIAGVAGVALGCLLSRMLRK